RVCIRGHGGTRLPLNAGSRAEQACNTQKGKGSLFHDVLQPDTTSNAPSRTLRQSCRDGIPESGQSVRLRLRMPKGPFRGGRRLLLAGFGGLLLMMLLAGADA